MSPEVKNAICDVYSCWEHCFTVFPSVPYLFNYNTSSSQKFCWQGAYSLDFKETQTCGRRVSFANLPRPCCRHVWLPPALIPLSCHRNIPLTCLVTFQLVS